MGTAANTGESPSFDKVDGHSPVRRRPRMTKKKYHEVPPSWSLRREAFPREGGIASTCTRRAQGGRVTAGEMSEGSDVHLEGACMCARALTTEILPAN